MKSEVRLKRLEKEDFFEFSSSLFLNEKKKNPEILLELIEKLFNFEEDYVKV